MEELKEKMLTSIITVKDIIDSIREPIGNDYSNMMKFASENRILISLEKLIHLADSPLELEQINNIFLEVSRSLQNEIRIMRKKLDV